MPAAGYTPTSLNPGTDWLSRPLHSRSGTAIFRSLPGCLRPTKMFWHSLGRATNGTPAILFGSGPTMALVATMLLRPSWRPTMGVSL